MKRPFLVLVLSLIGLCVTSSCATKEHYVLYPTAPDTLTVHDTTYVCPHHPRPRVS